MDRNLELFQLNPRDFALELVDSNVIDPTELLTAALKWMSDDEVRDMLAANGLMPRYDGAHDEEQANHDGYYTVPAPCGMGYYTT